ncbi:MAG: flagellar biosynthesis anti-sigma factor FlgM [Desulfosalsimonadaceae bacterium]
MKIHPGHTIKQFENIQKKQQAERPQNADKAREGDKVAFSKELQQVRESGKDLSVDMERQERLQTVKEQIANGTYSPDSRKVAESLLKYIVEGRTNG